jgi:hypothetical protein
MLTTATKRKESRCCTGSRFWITVIEVWRKLHMRNLWEERIV